MSSSYPPDTTGGGRHRPPPGKAAWLGRWLLILAACLAPLPAQALSNDLKHLLNSIGRDIKANQSGRNCEPQLFAAVGVELEHVSRDLLDFRLSEDSSEKHERYEGGIKPHEVAAGGVQAPQCSGSFNALWLIKPGTKADAGNIRISADVTACPCGTADELKTGHLQFVVPVIRKHNNLDGTDDFSAGTAWDFLVEAECCSGPRQSRTGGFEAPATATRSDSPPPKAQAVPPPAPPPRVAPKPSQPSKPPPATPRWSVDNPCPPCQSWKDYLDRTLAEIARLEAENRALDEDARKLDADIARKQAEIDRLNKVIRLQEGTGGSATNYPQPGWSTESLTQADGRVKITVRDGSGRVVEESYREREDIGRLRKKLDELEQVIKQDQEQQDRIRDGQARNRRGIEVKKGQAEAYRRGLEDCVREKCPGLGAQAGQVGQQVGQVTSALPIPAPEPVKPTQAPKPAEPPGQAVSSSPAQPVAPSGPSQAAEPPRQAGCPIRPSQPFEVGPRDQVGTGATHSIEKAASGFLGGLLGKATGGMLGAGGDGDNGPDLVKDPIRDKYKQTFKLDDLVELKVGAEWTPGGLLFSMDIVKAPDKGTFQWVAMQDEDCQWEAPDDFLWYSVWAEWSLTVSWTKTTYVDNQKVKEEKGGYQKQGRADIARGVVDVGRNGQILLAPKVLEVSRPPEPPIWKAAGFSAATGGIQSMGTLFKLKPEEMDNRVSQLTIHITNPGADPVTTIPLDFVIIGQNLLAEAGEPDKIPLLKDIPLIGKMFTQKGDTASAKRPLIMMLKPTILRGGD